MIAQCWSPSWPLAPAAQARARRARHGHGRRSDGRRHPERDGDGDALDADHAAAAIRRRRPTRASPRRPASRRAATSIQAEFPGFEPARAEATSQLQRRQQARRRARIEGLQDSVTVARDAQRGGVGSPRDVRHGADARADRSAVGRSGRDGAAAAGHGRRQRRHPRGQLRGRPAAAEGDDQGDPHHARRVRGGEPHRRRPVHRHHHAARHRPAARRACNMRLRDGSMSGSRRARSPTGQGARAQRRTTAASFGGSLIKQKASFSINVNGDTSFDTPYFYVRDAGAARRSEALAPRRPRDNMYRLRPVRLRADAGPDAARQLQPGPIHAARTSASAATTCSSARYDNEEHNHTLRIQEAGPLGRRFFINTRASINWSNVESHVGLRGADDPRHRRVHERRRAAARRDALEERQPRSRISTTCAASTRCAPASARRRHRTAPTTVELPRHLHVREPRRLPRRARRAATRAASAIRTSTTGTCRPASTSRTTSASART